MGVYIKGMEMPTNCALMLKIFPDGRVGVPVHLNWCGTMVVNDAEAIPVPPHGDLIDRRETIIDANERAYDFWLSDDEVNATIQFLEEQPTIIPAEEGET